MAEEPERDDQTEAPTPRRLERAREQGQVALSQELPALAVLAAAAVVLALAMPALTHLLVARLARVLEQAHQLDAVETLRAAALLAVTTAAPLVLAVLVGACAATVGQTGFLVHMKSLAPDLARLSPGRGLARVFGVQSLITAGKSLLKVVVVGWAAWHALASTLPLLHVAPFWNAAELADRTTRLVLQVIVAMLVAQALIATADILLTRLRHARSLRMSRQDLRDEAKEMEGDPQVKGRLKRIRLQRARRRMLAAVPKATVVITNPTHYAVALAYGSDGGGAPRIVAKGVDEVAARIRAVAEQHRVPIVANPPLARALYPHELDREIPEAFYKPVAEIIAYVWRMRGAPR